MCTSTVYKAGVMGNELLGLCRVLFSINKLQYILEFRGEISCVCVMEFCLCTVQCLLFDIWVWKWLKGLSSIFGADIISSFHRDWHKSLRKVNWMICRVSCMLLLTFTNNKSLNRRRSPVLKLKWFCRIPVTSGVNGQLKISGYIFH